MVLDFEDIKKAIKMMDRNGQLDLARWIINQDRIKRFSETDEDILSIRRGLDNYNEGIIFTSGEVKRKLLGRNLITMCVRTACRKRDRLYVYGTDYPTPDGTIQLR